MGSKIATLALFVVMARVLGEDGFGEFTFAFAIATIVTVLAGLGQDVVLTREVARDRHRLDALFWNTIALKLALGLPALVVAVVLGAAAGLDRDTILVVLVLGVAVLAELLTATSLAVFQAYERLAFVPVVLISQRLLTALAGIAALLAGADVVGVAAVYLGGAVVGLWLALALLVAKVARPRLELGAHDWWPLMRVALPIGLVGVFGTILFRVDAAMLGLYEPDPVVGDYGAAYRLFETTLFVSWSVGTAIYPVVSRLSRTSDPPVGLVYERALKLVLAPTLPLALAAAILAGPIVRLVYGGEFEEAVSALALLAPAIALYPVAHVAGTVVIAQDRQVPMAVAHGVVALQNVLGNLVLIPWLSLDGAALGTSISQALLTAWLLWLARGAAGPVSVRRVVGGPALAGAAAAAVMGALAREPALAAALAAVVYSTVLVAYERVAHPADASAVWAFLRRGRITEEVG